MGKSRQGDYGDGKQNYAGRADEHFFDIAVHEAMNQIKTVSAR